MNCPATTLPIAEATCTDGPSLPTDKPEAIAIGCVCVRYQPSSPEQSQPSAQVYQRNRLDGHGREGEEPLDDETCEDAFDLGDAGSCRVWGVRFDDISPGEGEETLLGGGSSASIHTSFPPTHGTAHTKPHLANSPQKRHKNPTESPPTPSTLSNPHNCPPPPFPNSRIFGSTTTPGCSSPISNPTTRQ